MSVLTDPISDLLTRIKNASRAVKEECLIPFSGIKAEIANWTAVVRTSGASAE